MQNEERVHRTLNRTFPGNKLVTADDVSKLHVEDIDQKQIEVLSGLAPYLESLMIKRSGTGLTLICQIKKVIAVLILILISTVAMCQSSRTSVYYATSVTTGVMNNYTGKYDWSPYEDLNEMEIIMKGDIVLISDKAGSAYTLYQKILDKTDRNGVKQSGWDAYDESRTKCTVKVVKYTDGGLMLYVMYSNIAFGYTIKQ